MGRRGKRAELVLNCDIEIDGEFVGNTPSTLTVVPGKHAVTVKKTGYADWTRNMTVGEGSVRLSAEDIGEVILGRIRINAGNLGMPNDSPFLRRFRSNLIIFFERSDILPASQP